jgi:hypothetical protein
MNNVIRQYTKKLSLVILLMLILLCFCYLLTTFWFTNLSSTGISLNGFGKVKPYAPSLSLSKSNNLSIAFYHDVNFLDKLIAGFFHRGITTPIYIKNIRVQIVKPEEYPLVEKNVTDYLVPSWGEDPHKYNLQMGDISGGKAKLLPGQAFWIKVNITYIYELGGQNTTQITNGLVIGPVE